MTCQLTEAFQIAHHISAISVATPERSRVKVVFEHKVHHPVAFRLKAITESMRDELFFDRYTKGQNIGSHSVPDHGSHHPTKIGDGCRDGRDWLTKCAINQDQVVLALIERCLLSGIRDVSESLDDFDWSISLANWCTLFLQSRQLIVI